MPTKPVKTRGPQNRTSNVTLYPLSPDDAVRAVLSISKEDAKRIVSAKPKKKR